MKCQACGRGILKEACTCGCCRTKPGLYIPLRMIDEEIRVCLNCAMVYLYPRHGARGVWNDPHKRVYPRTDGRTLGFEFEANWPPQAMIEWREMDCEVKDDGSLRGNTAAEIITLTPTTLDQYNYQQFLELSPVKYGIGNKRCSIHIWFGAQDHSWMDANRMLLWCAIHEKSIIRMLPASRTPTADHTPAGMPMSLAKWFRKNAMLHVDRKSFFRSMYGTGPFFDGEVRIHTRRPNNGGAAFPDGLINRCWWLNMSAYMHSRCYEIRLLHFTPNTEVICAWVEFWLRVMEWVKGKDVDALYGTPPRKVMPALAKRILIPRRATKKEGAGDLDALTFATFRRTARPYTMPTAFQAGRAPEYRFDHHAQNTDIVAGLRELATERGWRV